MDDRLRDLIDLIVASTDEPGADGATLAARANFSRDHFDRIVGAAAGESPVALRRRLLLERAAWRLRTSRMPVAAVAEEAAYTSSAAFSRAFTRAYGIAPSAFATGDAPVPLPSANGIHFHGPAGLGFEGATGGTGGGRGAPGGAGGSRDAGGAGAADLTERLVLHHLDRVRSLLRAAGALSADALARPLRPGLVILPFDGEEASAAALAEALVHTLEIWVAAVDGTEFPGRHTGPLEPRFARAATAFERFARRVRDGARWDEGFVDALCEPPQSFTYGGVLAHVLSFGAVRREALAGVLSELGADVPDDADPITWEERRAAPGRSSGTVPAGSPARG